MLTPEWIAENNAKCDRWVAEQKAQGVVFFQASAELMSLYSKVHLELATLEDLAEIQRLEAEAIAVEQEQENAAITSTD